MPRCARAPVMWAPLAFLLSPRAPGSFKNTKLSFKDDCSAAAPRLLRSCSAAVPQLSRLLSRLLSSAAEQAAGQAAEQAAGSAAVQLLLSCCSAAAQLLLSCCSAAAQPLLSRCAAAAQPLLSSCSAAAQQFLSSCEHILLVFYKEKHVFLNKNTHVLIVPSCTPHMCGATGYNEDMDRFVRKCN